jgi:hypothetical protein
MTDAEARDVLDKALQRLRLIPPAIYQDDGFSITSELLDGIALPPPLHRLLDNYELHPELAVYTALAVQLLDFGARCFRVLVSAALHNQRWLDKGCDTDLDRNHVDFVFVKSMLSQLMFECINTKIVPTQAVKLLGRLTGALNDIWTMNAKPAFFDITAPPGGYPPWNDTVAVRCEAKLAAALEILIAVGGMKLTPATEWLDQQLRDVELVHRIGNPIPVRRVIVWRGHFRKRQGSQEARTQFNFAVQCARRAFPGPSGEQKVAAVQREVRRDIELLAITRNRTIAPPRH